MFERIARALGWRERRPAGGGLDRQGVETVPFPAERGGLPALADDGIDVGEWPADPDVVPAWRLRAEAAAARGGYRIPSYRTRSQYEHDLAMLRLSAGRDAEDYLPALSAADAAHAFWAHVMSTASGDIAPEFTNDELSESYLAFCESCERRPAAENLMRGALRKLPGVERIQVNNQRGREVRSRHFIWLFCPPETLDLTAETVSETVRRAA